MYRPNELFCLEVWLNMFIKDEIVYFSLNNVRHVNSEHVLFCRWQFSALEMTYIIKLRAKFSAVLVYLE